KPPRQSNRKCTTLAQRAFQRNISAQQPAQLADDREAQASARMLASHRVAVGQPAGSLPEFFEYQLLFVRTDADSRIRNFQPQIPQTVPLGRDQNAPTLRCKLDCVRQQVIEDLLNFCLILSQYRQTSRRVAIEIDILLLRERPGHFTLRSNERADL